MAAKPLAPSITLAAVADEWRQLMRAAQEPGIAEAESRALIEQADAVLGRLVGGTTSNVLLIPRTKAPSRVRIRPVLGIGSLPGRSRGGREF
jgi:hypothetical protein